MILQIGKADDSLTFEEKAELSKKDTEKALKALVDIVGEELKKGEKVQMVGFTTRSIQIKLRRHQNFNKTYTWDKNVFKSQEEAKEVFEKMKEEK